MASSYAKIIKRTDVINEQVPGFVSNDHQTFVKFLEAYYEFLSTKQFVASERLQDYLDIDSVPEDFLNYFWEEIKEIPGTVIVDKRLLAKHIRDLYASKGTRKSIELLFRILYNEDIKIYEPKDDVLRASDGKWVATQIIRTKVPIGFNINTLNGRKLYQYNLADSETAQFIVANVSIVESDSKYLYIEITPSSLVGDIDSKKRLYTRDRKTSLEIIESFGISSYQERGALYLPGDVFYAGNLPCYVRSVATGKVDGVFIIDGGTGYSVGDYLTFDESGSGGAGVSVRVTSVTGGGAVSGVFVVSNGRGYETLPKCIGNGSGVFLPYSDSIGRVLDVVVKDASSQNEAVNVSTRAITTDIVGLTVDEAIYKISDNVINENGLGILTEDGGRIETEDVFAEPIFIGKVDTIDSDFNIRISDNFGQCRITTEDGASILDESESFIIDEQSTLPLGRCRVRSESGLEFSILFAKQASIKGSLESIFRIPARFINEDGFVSQSNKKIHDSLFYQDFSYVIQSAQSFKLYKNILRKIVHPAGIAVFGEVKLDTYIRIIENRIQKSFADLKIFSDVTLSLRKTSDIDFVYKIESRGCIGTSYEFLERYKFIIGSDYTNSVYGSSYQVGISDFDRDTPLQPPDMLRDSVSMSAFMQFTLNDIYEYDSSYLQTRPLTLDGSFILDGSQTLDGTNTPEQTVNDTIGKYKLRRNKRLPYALGAEIRITPSQDIEDEIIMSDSVSFVLTSSISELLGMSESIASIAGIAMNINENFILVDNLDSQYTFNSSQTDSLTILDLATLSVSPYVTETFTVVDQISRMDLSGTNESVGVSDVVVWEVSTISSIGSTAINSSPI